MPTIKLKPNSPDFADGKSGARAAPKTARQAHLCSCEYPGCAEAGDFRAPKGRDLKDYYNFCLAHVQEYNRAWDFFSGMSEDEIEAHIIASMHGDRPTWRYDNMAGVEKLHRKARASYNFNEEDDEDEKPRRDPRHGPKAWPGPEFEALTLMGLEPPVDLAAIKARYKQLAMRYHPDRNRDDPQAEEILKRINMAYTVLKIAYSAYEKLPERA